MNDFGTRGTRAQKGFTLIEMSIVLVIIGLIIGGILKGQEIIESSRQKNMIVAIDAMRSATNTFFDRFQALPGDFHFASSRIASGYTDGDGNGVVGAAATAGGAGLFAGNGAQAENVGYFVHLFGARLIGGVTPGGATGSYGEGAVFPAGAFPASGFTVIYGSYNDTAADTKVGHWLRITKVTSGSTNAGVLSPKAMYAIDAKTDDGLPQQGSFRSGLGTNCGGTAYTATDESLICGALAVIGN